MVPTQYNFAIGNILLLRGQITIQPPERTTVSYDYLARLLGEYLLVTSSGEDTSAALSVMPATRSASSIYRLLHATYCPNALSLDLRNVCSLLACGLLMFRVVLI